MRKMQYRIFKNKRFNLIAIALLLAWLPALAIGKDLLFCTPNTKDQRVFKVSHRLLAEAFSRLGYGFKLVTYPAKRCPTEVDNGHVDGDSHRIFNFNANGEYPNLVRVEESIQSIDQCAFTKNLNIRPAGWASIRHYQIIYLPGIKVIEMGLEKAGVPPENRIQVLNHEQAFKMLAMDRGDLIIVSSNTGKHFLKELDLLDSGIKLLTPPLVQFDLYPYMHKKHTYLAKKMDLILKAMKRDGTYEKLTRSDPY